MNESTTIAEKFNTSCSTIHHQGGNQNIFNFNLTINQLDLVDIMEYSSQLQKSTLSSQNSMGHLTRLTTFWVHKICLNDFKRV